MVNNDTMKKAVITGASGFMGRALSVYLADRGVRVFAVTAPGGKAGFEPHENITSVECELSADRFSVFLDAVRPDVLFHLAWHGMTAELKNSYPAQLSNIPVYTDVLGACVGRDIRVIIPGSTSEYAYCGGTVDGFSAPAPGDAYSSVKSALQTICRTFARQNGVHLCWLLIGSVYGPGRIDNNIITYSVRSFLRGEETAFTGLEQMWDYLYVDDLMEALYLAGLYGRADSVYPVGSGIAQPLASYIETIHGIIAPKLPLGIGKLPYKNGKTPDGNVPDITAFSRDTGFSPKVSFADGILKTIEFIRQTEV